MINYNYTRFYLLLLFVGCLLTQSTTASADLESTKLSYYDRDTTIYTIPRCPDPEFVSYFEKNSESVLIQWDDVSADPGFVQYQIRYKKAQGISSWKIFDVTSGQECIIDRLRLKDEYLFQIRKICLSNDGTYTAESNWIPIQKNQNRTPSISICNSLGDIEAQGSGAHNITFSVPGSYSDSISLQDCNIIFQTIWCNPGSTCYTLYWIYDGSQTFDFAGELVRLYPGASNPQNYLSEISALVVCPTTPPGLTLGTVYSQSQWTSLSVPQSCPDTLLYEAPVIINHNCGETFSIPSVENQSPLASAQVSDVFTIGGYPMTLTSVSGSNGTFSGSADIQLPWQGQLFNLNFSTLSVNEKGQVTSGAITVESDPVFDPGEISYLDIGGQICIPPTPPSYFDSLGNNSVTGLGWDPNGFGPDSSYIKDPPYTGFEEGDPYDPNFDPNGFAFDGTHAVTGTLYNEQGCDRNGLDRLGQPCNPAGTGPYYWLTENGNGSETLEGISFANDIKDTLSHLIETILLTMDSQLSDSVDLKRISCDVIRSNMDGLISTLNYDREFIVGVNEEYYEEGMHENFSTRPQPFQVSMSRDENTIELENEHIALYECDEKLKIFLNIQDIISDFLETPGSGDLKDLLLEKIKRFTTSEATQYQDLNEFMIWLENNILNQIDKEYKSTYGSIGSSAPKEPFLPFDFQDMSSYPDYIVSTSASFLSDSKFHPVNINVNNHYSVISKFRNGDIWINGTHRAIILEQISKNVALDDILTGSTSMPIRISKEVGGIVYTILIDRITLTTTGATLDAYMVIEDPRSGQKLVFQGLNIGFSPNGAVDSQLSLASEVSIRLNNTARLIIHGTDSTYVSWDCNGFTGMGVDASVEFCREFLTPLDSITLEPLPENDTSRVQAHFIVDVPAWGQFTAELSITPFAVTKYDQIKWVVDKATLDFSDLETPEIEFPEAYNSPFVENGVALDSWKGFHLSELSATFIDQFSDDGNEVSVGVENMIIDDRGFTGEVFVQSNILSLNDGNLSGWPISIDSLQVLFVANHLLSGSLSGHINVPIFEADDPDEDITEKDCFKYKASMHKDGGFCFAVSTTGSDLIAPLFKAGEVILYPNSSIVITKNDTSFTAVAKLNGSVVINASITPTIGLNLDTIKFSGFEVSNKAPYFSPGIWSLPGSIGINVGGFGASIGELNVFKGDEVDEVALSVRLKLSLSGQGTDDELGLAADARVRVIGTLTVDEGRQKWIYKRFSIDQVTIDAEIKGNRVKGGLLFYEDDPVYNQGFRGILSLKLKALNAEVLAVAQFGKAETDFKYFFVDALVNLENGIGEGTFKILGLGGGLYYHMNRDTSAFAGIPSSPTGLPELGDLGVGLSNITYLPDSTVSIGFRATVVFASINEAAFNGNATFEMVFNSEGGIRIIAIEGNARFMAAVDFSQPPTIEEDATSPPIPAMELPLTAYVKIAYDFNNRILEGDLNVFLNTPTFKGIGPYGQMVWAKLYFSPNTWFINIGTPSNPSGIILEIPGVGQVGEVKAYLNIGNQIEDMRDLPPEVLSIAGDIRPHPMRGSGKGFAFGAYLHVSTGELKFLILRASLDAGVGFDVLVQDYGEATCFHSGNKPGINGWYASGQLYAFLEGKVGVKFAGKIIPIIELGVAAALQARLPNPVYINGAFGVRYRLLGGLVKGNHKFRFKLGTECQLIQPGGDSTVLGLDIIEHISPPQAAEEMPTDAEVVVLFNYPIGVPVEILNNENGVDVFQISILNEGLYWHGELIPANYESQEDYFVRVAKPEIYYPEKDTVQFVITVEVKKNGEVIGTETDTTWFITGGRPKVISPSNIAYTYPLDGQYNFHPKEDWSEDGYISLITGQPYLFQDDNKPELFLYNSDGTTHLLNYVYDVNSQIIRFDLPPELLSAGEIYKLALISIDEDTLEVVEDEIINLPGLSQPISQQQYLNYPPTDDMTLPRKKVLTQMIFRVSLYETFEAKIQDVLTNKTAIGGDIIKITPNVPEILGFHDLVGVGIDPLVSIKGKLDGIPWYKNEIYDRLYKYFPTNHGNELIRPMVPFLNRADQTLGIPPVEAIKMNLSTNGEDRVTEQHFLAGSIAIGNMPIIYSHIQDALKHDWFDIKRQLRIFQIEYNTSSLFLGPHGTAMNYILDNNFTVYPGSTYKYVWRYTLPSGRVTSEVDMVITAYDPN